MKPVTVKDLLDFSFYGNLKAKKGSVLFVKAQIDQKNDAYLYNLMRYQNGKCVQLTGRNTVSDFIFQDADQIWFTASAFKSQETQFYRLNLNGGEALQMGTVPLAGISLCGISGTWLIGTLQESVSREEDHPDYEVLDERSWYFNGAGFINKKRNHLIAVSLEDFQYKILAKDLDISQVTLHKDRIFVSAAHHSVRSEEDHEGIYEVETASGTVHTLVPESEGLDIYSLNALEDQLLFFASDGTPIGLNSNPRLYRYDLQAEKMSLAFDWNEALGNTVGTDCAVVPGNAVCLHKNRLYFTSTIVSHNNLFCYENGSVHQVLEWNGTIQSFGFAGKHLYFIGAAENELQQLYEIKNQKAVCLSDFNPQLKDHYVAKAQPVFYTGYNDSQQMGWVLYPRDFDPETRYPAILDIHGGPKTVYGTVFYHEMQVWASRGYFVFFCNPFGSDGQGNEYADLRSRYGTHDYEDLMAFTDAVISRIPQIDPSRIGVTGGSYGGFMTNWIIGHTDRFKTAASQRSISNWLSFYGTSDIGVSFVKDQMGCALEDVERLWEQSPLKYKNNIKTPTLFIHSDEDYRCPLEQGLQMYNAVLDAKQDARLVLFHGENHDLSRTSRPSHRLRRLNEITNWMDRSLKDKSEETENEKQQPPAGKE